jgi:primary-amine oxidase
MMRTLRLTRLDRALVVMLILALAAPVVSAPDRAAAVTPNCGSTAFLINTTMPNGARWTMCWEERQAEGIVLHHVYFTPRNGVQRLVLYRASIAQIHVPYDNNAARFHDVSDYGLGGYNMNDLTTADCPGGTLLRNNGKDVLCRTLARDGYAYKYYGTQKQAYALSLFSVSHIGQYNYIPKWKFFDDGTIEPGMGATGKLQLCTNDSRYGWLVNSTSCPRGTSHMHNYYWRLDFDLGGLSNDRLQRFDFGNAGGSTRPASSAAYSTETRQTVSPGVFRTWRLYDNAITNGDGHRISYEIVPDASHTFRGPSYEPWTRYDLYYTQNATCERYASHNPTTGGCPSNVSSFVNGQSVSDAVVWYGLNFHHVARDEDEPYMSAHWSGFQLVPRDMTSVNTR